MHGVRSCNITCNPAASVDVPHFAPILQARAHVKARGNAREAIFADDTDRKAPRGLPAHESGSTRALWAHCLMDNHYHLLIATGARRAARDARNQRGLYPSLQSLASPGGHELQGRYEAVLVSTLLPSRACKTWPCPR